MCNGMIEACGFDGRHGAEVTGHPKRPSSPQGGEAVHGDHLGGELRSLIRELPAKGQHRRSPTWCLPAQGTWEIARI